MAVHPRAGGEHTHGYIAIRHGVGSSPRRRGTQPGDVARQVLARFIPAQAGNTLPYTVRPTTPSVHPRAGGEHVKTCPEGLI